MEVPTLVLQYVRRTHQPQVVQCLVHLEPRVHDLRPLVAGWFSRSLCSSSPDSACPSTPSSRPDLPTCGPHTRSEMEIVGSWDRPWEGKDPEPKG